MRSRDMMPIWLLCCLTSGQSQKLTSLRVNRNLIWQLSRDGKSHNLGMSHTTMASPKPSLRSSWRHENGDNINSGSPYSCQKCSRRPPAEEKKIEEDLCWFVPHVHPTTQSGKGLNWTELNWAMIITVFWLFFTNLTWYLCVLISL